MYHLKGMLAKGCLSILLKLGNLHKALSLYSGSGTHRNCNLDIIAFWVRISVFLQNFFYNTADLRNTFKQTGAVEKYVLNFVAAVVWSVSCV